ncbi:MAG: hypothetical protein EBX52_03690 [Proteobacteria bacterium]|nr:hypothetical protein [Pseudomonadota bacterium]
MKKQALRLTLTISILTGVIAWTLWKDWQKRSPNPAPENLTVEEILRKRTEGAEQILKSGLALTLMQKNWKDFDAKFVPERDGTSLAEAVRAIFIKTGMKDFSMADQDRLLLGLLKSAAILAEKSPRSIGPVLAQIERLPAPDRGSPAFIVLDQWIKNHDETPGILQRTALIKLVFQETAPEERHLAALKRVLFDHPLPNNSLDEWISRIEIMKSDSSAIETCKFLFQHLDRIPRESVPTLLRAVAGHSSALERETFALLKKTTGRTDPYAVEASLMTIERLVKSGKTARKDLESFDQYVRGLDAEKLVQPLRMRREDVLRLLVVPPAQDQPGNP